MRKGNNILGENDAFVTLIRVSQEDPDMKKTLSGILAQSSFHRKSLLNTMIAEMKLKSAPIDFVNAISALLDDGVAEKVRDVIQR